MTRNPLPLGIAIMLAKSGKEPRRWHVANLRDRLTPAQWRMLRRNIASHLLGRHPSRAGTGIRLVRALVLGTLAVALCASEAERWDDHDKLLHIGAGAVIGAASVGVIRWASPQTPALQRAALALVPVVVAAVGKELLDRRHPERHDAEARDAIATIAGGCVGVSISFTF